MANAMESDLIKVLVRTLNTLPRFVLLVYKYNFVIHLILPRHKNFVLILKLSPVVDRSELFTIHLPRLPVTNVGGGAELRALDTVARIEPYGVIQFSEESREMSIPEPENNNLEVNTHADQPQNNQTYSKTHKHYCKTKMIKPVMN